MDRRELWIKAFTGLYRPSWVEEAWLRDIERDPLGALELARGMVEALESPDTVVLGLDPRPLVAALAEGGRVTVLAEREVLRGAFEAALASHRVLEAFRGLVEVLEVRLHPAPGEDPRRLMGEAEALMDRLRPEVVDVTGSSALMALAASTRARALTYTYATGEVVRIAPLSYRRARGQL